MTVRSEIIIYLTCEQRQSYNQPIPIHVGTAIVVFRTVQYGPAFTRHRRKYRVNPKYKNVEYGFNNEAIFTLFHVLERPYYVP